MSEALINRLVEFAESGNQQKIVVAGKSRQGWVMEITEEIQQAELFYWDNKADQWTEFKL